MKPTILPMLTFNNKPKTHTANGNLTRKINVVATTGLTLQLPSTKSKTKEFVVIATGYNVTVACAATNGTITSGAAVGGSSVTVANGASARFVSVGSVWYRVA